MHEILAEKLLPMIYDWDFNSFFRNFFCFDFIVWVVLSIFVKKFLLRQLCFVWSVTTLALLGSRLAVMKTRLKKVIQDKYARKSKAKILINE